jgi:NTE family protein
VIIAEPMAHLFGTDSAAAGAGAVIRLVPDSTAIQAFGPDITSLAAWVPAYQAGIGQAPEAARLIGCAGSPWPSWRSPQW